MCISVCFACFQVHEFFFFAGMTALVTIIFILMSLRYKYVEHAAPDEASQAQTRAERYTLLDEDQSGQSS